MILPSANLQEVHSQYKAILRVYQQNQWQISDSETSSDSEIDNGDSCVHFEPITIKLAVRKIRIYVECLRDIGQSLDRPALDDWNDQEPSLLGTDQRTAEDYHTERLRAKFPSAEIRMLQGLGKASWYRYQRMQKERELNAQRQNVAKLDGRSCASRSEFVDSGLGASTAAASSSYATSVMSLMSSISRGRRAHVPSLSAEAKDGSPFDCVACGKVVKFTNDNDWM